MKFKILSRLKNNLTVSIKFVNKKMRMHAKVWVVLEFHFCQGCQLLRGPQARSPDVVSLHAQFPESFNSRPYRDSRVKWRLTSREYPLRDLKDAFLHPKISSWNNWSALIAYCYLFVANISMDVIIRDLRAKNSLYSLVSFIFYLYFISFFN